MVSRRTFLRDLGKGIIFVASYPVLRADPLNAATLQPTPPNTEGPFYLPGAPFRANLREDENGTPLKVNGSLVDTSDRPITNGLIEIWHVDQSGEYDLDGFRYRASMKTSKQGEYAFETFMPKGYGGRPRHIHYKVSAGGFETLVTQLYFENDPFFEGKIDQTLHKDSLVRYRELIRPVVPFREGQEVAVIFKICLAR
ncbi:intradiol ring-cleavage dioxygenase [bacterium]|nr:intradiol ring-cleavage dioxygenase [bacterium]MCI0603647.1 intradiol ring-cleavage dioxygenase [bacterium]